MKQTYGEQLRELIKKKDINQVELAKEYGCTPDNVQKALKSKTMKPDTFDKWLRTIDSLVERKCNDILAEAHRQYIENTLKSDQSYVNVLDKFLDRVKEVIEKEAKED